jgi:hypothetical protein
LIIVAKISSTSYKLPVFELELALLGFLLFKPGAFFAFLGVVTLLFRFNTLRAAFRLDLELSFMLSGLSVVTPCILLVTNSDSHQIIRQKHSKRQKRQQSIKTFVNISNDKKTMISVVGVQWLIVLT